VTVQPIKERSAPGSARYALYRGRYQSQARLVALVGIGVLIATSKPYPSVHGRGLVILITLVIALAAHGSAVFFPEKFPLVRNAVEMAASAILAGYDPGTAEVLLVFAGLDASASLTPSVGAFVTASGVVTDLLATFIASNRIVDGLYGLAAVAGFLLGSTLRQYVLRVEQVELRLADVERADMEKAKAVQLAGRTEVAREIHDILAHNLGALVVQLDAVNALLEDDLPNLDKIRPVLRDAHRHALDGLAEARQAVGSLRGDSRPLMGTLQELVDSVPGASLDVDGSPREPPADVSIVVRRVAQEGLTNAMKHAPGADSKVRIDFGPQSILLTVADGGRPDGVAPVALAATGGGYGIEGMRERAEMIGATFKAGRDGPGWKVELDVPDRIPR